MEACWRLIHPRINVFVTLAAALVLAACAGAGAYREGNALLAEGKSEAGLTKLEEAVRLEPGNVEYRITLGNQRASIINRLVAVGEEARRAGSLSEAEKAYRRVQALDAENAMARQGMEALLAERQHRESLAEAEALFKKGTPPDLVEALGKVQAVLQQNPRQREALNLKLRIDQAQAKTAQQDTRLAAGFRKPISLEFRDAPLRSVLDVVSQVSGLNFFYDREIRPDLKATVFAKNTTIEDVIRLILVTNQLEQKVLNDNSILIYPATPQKIKDYQTLSVRSFYLANADVKAVSNSIKTLLKTKDMVVDERLGIIILRDTPEVIRMAERIVALQDLSDPEVMLEVEILEIKRSRLLELGIQWPSQLALSPLAVDGSTLTLAALQSLNGSTISASVGSLLINARKEDQDGNILANPRIRVRNKEKAKIQIGDRVPVITTTSTSTGFVSESVNYIDVGLKLEVEPDIYLDEEVAIKVNLEVSNLVREILSRTGTLSYQIGTRIASTTLRLKDGETQILAGLISDDDRSTANKVPGLGELPIAGRLFGSQKDDQQRTEILLSITPRIVRSIRRPDFLMAEFESGTEASIGAQALRLGTVETTEGKPSEKPPTAASIIKTVPDPAAAASTPTPVAAGVQREAASTVSEPKTAKTPVAAAGELGLSWQAPSEVKAGEQFSAVLRVSSQQALRGMPTLIGFDPQAMQVVSVMEGDFFKQGNAQTSFSSRVDPAQGRVFIAQVRQGSAGSDPGINGTGSLLTVVFKALKATDSVGLQLLSASPEPVQTVTLPVEQAVRLLP